MKDQKKTTGTGNSDEAPKHELIVHSEKKWHEKVPKSVWLILLLIAVGFAFYYFSPRENGGVPTETAEQQENKRLKAEVAELRNATADTRPSTGFAPPQGAAQTNVEIQPGSQQMAPTENYARRTGGTLIRHSSKDPVFKGGKEYYFLYNHPTLPKQMPTEPVTRDVSEIQANMTFEKGATPPKKGRLAVFDTRVGPDGQLMNILAWEVAGR